MYLSATRKAALEAYDQFIASYQAKFPKAIACLQKDKEWSFTFYDFPAQHWSHLRTTNPIESTFATVRLRTQRTKGCGSRIATLTMAFRLGIEAQKHWRRLNGSALLPKVVTGVQFIDLLIVSETTSNSREVAISGSTGRTRDYGCGRIRHVRPNKSPEVIYAHFGCQCYASDCLFAKGLFTSL